MSIVGAVSIGIFAALAFTVGIHDAGAAIPATVMVALIYILGRNERN